MEAEENMPLDIEEVRTPPSRKPGFWERIFCNTVDEPAALAQVKEPHRGDGLRKRNVSDFTAETSMTSSDVSPNPESLEQPKVSETILEVPNEASENRLDDIPDDLSQAD